MTATTDFDRRLADWLAADGDQSVPEGLVSSAVALARDTPQRHMLIDRLATRLTWPAVGLPSRNSSRPAPRTVVLLALLAALVGGALIVASGAFRPRPTPAVLGVFKATGDLASEVGLAMALRLADGTVLIADGFGLQRYDPASGRFSQLPDTTHQVRGWTQAANGDLLIVHVEEEPSEPPTGRSRVVVDRLPDVGAGGPSVEIGRSDFFFLQSAVALRDGRFVILGQDFGVSALVALVFDPEAGTFTRGGGTRPALNGEHASLLPDGRILVIDQGSDCLTMNVVAYDPAVGTFSSIVNLPCAVLFSTTVLPDGRVLVAGGGRTPVAGGASLTAAAYLIDPGAGTSTSVGPLPEQRWMHAAAPAADGRVLIAGGYVGESGGAPATSTLLFDPATATFAAGPDLIDGRLNATAVPLVDGRVLIFGHTPLTQGGPPGPGPRAEIFFR